MTDNDWDTMILVADKKTKAAKGKAEGKAEEKAVFRLFSLGVVTARDEWVYGLSDDEVANKVKFLIDVFDSESKAYKSSKLPLDTSGLSKSIKWSRLLKTTLEKDRSLSFSCHNIVRSAFRPFVNRALYFDRYLNEYDLSIATNVWRAKQ